MIASTLNPLPSQLGLGSKVHFPEDVSVILRSDDQNFGNLFLSNIQAASNTSLLQKLGVGAVMCAAKGMNTSHPKTSVPYSKYVPIEKEAELGDFVEEAVGFINLYISKTNVLVHCVAGNKRSAAIVIAFLMREKGFSLEDAYNEVRARKKFVELTDTLEHCLMNYEIRMQKRGHGRAEAPSRSQTQKTQRSGSDHISSHQVSQRLKTGGSRLFPGDIDEIQSQRSMRSARSGVSNRSKIVSHRNDPIISINVPVDNFNPEESFTSDRLKTNNNFLDKSFAGSQHDRSMVSQYSQRSSMRPRAPSRHASHNRSGQEFIRKVEELESRNNDINQRLSHAKERFEVDTQRSKNHFVGEMMEIDQLKSNIQSKIVDRKARRTDKSRHHNTPATESINLEALPINSSSRRH